MQGQQDLSMHSLTKTQDKEGNKGPDFQRVSDKDSVFFLLIGKLVFLATTNFLRSI